MLNHLALYEVSGALHFCIVQQRSFLYTERMRYACLALLLALVGCGGGGTRSVVAPIGTYELRMVGGANPQALQYGNAYLCQLWRTDGVPQRVSGKIIESSTVGPGDAVVTGDTGSASGEIRVMVQRPEQCVGKFLGQVKQGNTFVDVAELDYTTIKGPVFTWTAHVIKPDGPGTEPVVGRSITALLNPNVFGETVTDANGNLSMELPLSATLFTLPRDSFRAVKVNGVETVFAAGENGLLVNFPNQNEGAVHHFEIEYLD